MASGVEPHLMSVETFMWTSLWLQAQNLETILSEGFQMTMLRHSTETSLAPGLGQLPFLAFLFAVTWWVFHLHNGPLPQTG